MAVSEQDAVGDWTWTSWMQAEDVQEMGIKVRHLRERKLYPEDKRQQRLVQDLSAQRWAAVKLPR